MLEGYDASVTGRDRKTPPRRVRGLPTMWWLLRGGPHLNGQGWSRRRGVCQVVLTGRATTVPFTAVMTGHEGTTTDNAEAAFTCAVHCLRR